MITANHTPERFVRDEIDRMLVKAGRFVQSKEQILPKILIALVSLVRLISGADTTLTSFDKTVDKNFQEWIFKKQAGTLKYTEEQVQWLRMIKDYIANSFHVDKDDFELDPFNKQGGLGKMWQLLWRANG